jgi:UDP-N-acetylglucosamine 2-epimerase (non-hydrolysing)
VTVEIGTNVLVGRDLETIRRETATILAGKHKQGHVPPLWDGHAAERIAAVLTSCTEALLSPLVREFRVDKQRSG